MKGKTRRWNKTVKNGKPFVSLRELKLKSKVSLIGSKIYYFYKN